MSGFLTGLYVVLTPLLSAMILRTRIPPAVWAASVLATVGLGVLSLQGFAIGYGELLTVASAVVYALHIVALGRMSEPGTALQLSVVQMATIAVVCGIAAAPGGIQLPASGTDWAIVIYLALIAGRPHHGAADLGPGPGGGLPGRGDHGDGTGLGGRLRGRVRRREPDRSDDHRRWRDPGGHVPGGARTQAPSVSRGGGPATTG